MSARLTLSPDEVVELSGLLQPAAQIRWLSRVGIPHFVGADGRPRVVRDVLIKSDSAPRQPRLRLPK